MGYGYCAERNIELFNPHHVVSLFLPYQLPTEEHMALRERLGSSTPIWYDIDMVANQDVYVICIDLTYNNIDQKINLDPLVETAEMIRRMVREGCTVLLESTVGVGVTRKLFTGLNVHCAYSPTNFDANNVSDKAEDLPKLVGGVDDESELLAMQLYETVYHNVVRTGSPEVAEAAVMLKHAKQTMEDALMNEFADYCDTVPNLDIHRVIDATTTGSRDPRTALPWIGRANDINSKHLMDSTPCHIWPVLGAASEQLVSRPSKIYKKIVDRYCGGKYDMLHKLSFLVVGVGAVLGSPDTKDSPVLDIIRHLELEGAAVTKYDMFVSGYTRLPELKYNSGKHKFDGILVMHPYNVSQWERHDQTTFFCRH